MSGSAQEAAAGIHVSRRDPRNRLTNLNDEYRVSCALRLGVVMPILGDSERDSELLIVLSCAGTLLAHLQIRGLRGQSNGRTYLAKPASGLT